MKTIKKAAEAAFFSTRYARAQPQKDLNLSG
jgi:hypothetical protein